MDVVFLIGLPGAGKSSFYRSRLAQAHAHISKDLMKSRKNREKRQLRWLREELERGKSVVIDNMNVRRSDRAPSLAIAQEFHARCIAYYFPVSIEESLERNLGPGRKEVPKVGIYTAARDLEPPSPDEGFAKISEVRWHSHDLFDIAPEY